MVKGHHVQLRVQPPLLCNFHWFNFKSSLAHHLVIQKEVQELLPKEAIEPSTGGAGFYSNVSVVPSIWMFYILFFIISHVIATCTYLPLVYLLLNRFGSLFNRVIIFFSIDHKDAYLHVPIVKHHWQVCWQGGMILFLFPVLVHLQVTE